MVSTDEREKLKEELKMEILAELKTNSELSNPKKFVPGMNSVLVKWFKGDDKKNAYSKTKMHLLFGDKQHRVWDNVRALTRLIFDTNSGAKLNLCNQKQVEHVADTLCETIYSLRMGVFKIKRRRKQMETKEIEKLYHLLDDLVDDYRDLSGVSKAQNEIWNYLDLQGIIGNSGISPRRKALNNLIDSLEAESEKQGFIYGFRYAAALFSEIK